MNRTQWLNCTVAQGQFRDEFAVQGTDYQGQEFSLFTSRQFVKCDRVPAGRDEVAGLVQVTLLEQRGGLCLIQLPGKTFDNGSTITVRDQQLEDCTAREYA